ncbi:MAG: hypothetical protein DRQ02_11350 [Candidatus Latescibacterota bacterium]|nr:MAG: hypothetical protein DRQ02_11350 [Candidatus Latescibacterota bacterium]
MNLRRSFWIWFQNLGGTCPVASFPPYGAWREFIQFAAQWQIDSVIIWFPFSYMEGRAEDWKWPPRRGMFGPFGKEIVQYAHDQGVQFICGFPLNGYDVGAFILKEHPELQAKIPPELANTPKGKDSVGKVFCPSNETSQQMVQELLNILVEETGVDGFNFESGAVDYVTCHCPRCEKRFQSRGETEHENKPILWDIEQINAAIDFLESKGKGLQFSMDAIYGQVADPETLAKEIDRRCTILWGDWENFPDVGMMKELVNIRKNTGAMLRLHLLREPGQQALTQIVESCRKLGSLGLREIAGRAWIPRGWNAVKDALFAEATKNPWRSDSEFQTLIEKLYSRYPFQKGEEEVPPGDYNKIEGEWSLVNIV